MNNRDAIKLAKRIEAWQKRLEPLGVGHWRIDSVTVEESDMATNDASVTPSWRYDSCRFWFRQDYVDNATDRDLDETIVHEWLHVAMRDLDSAIESAEEQFSPAAREVWETRMVHEREAFIEHLARTIVTMYNINP